MKTALVVVIVVVYFQQLLLSISAQYGDDIEAVRDEWANLRKEDAENLVNRMHTLTLNVKRLVDQGRITPNSGKEYKWKYGFFMMDYFLSENKYVASTTISLPSINQWEESQKYLNNVKPSEIDKKSVDFIKRFYENIQSENEKDKLNHPVNNVERPLQKPDTDLFTNSFKQDLTRSGEIMKSESMSHSGIDKTGQITYSDPNKDAISNPTYYNSPDKTTSSKSDTGSKVSDMGAGPTPSSPYNGPLGRPTSDMTPDHRQSSPSFIPLSHQSSDAGPIPTSKPPIPGPLSDDVTNIPTSSSPGSTSHKPAHRNSELILDPPASLTSVVPLAQEPYITILNPPSRSTSFSPVEHQSSVKAPGPPPSTDYHKPLANQFSELTLGSPPKSTSFTVQEDKFYGTTPDGLPSLDAKKSLAQKYSELIPSPPPKSTSLNVPEVQSYGTAQDHPYSSSHINSLATKNSELTNSPSDRSATFRPLTPETSKNDPDPLINHPSNNYPKTDHFDSSSTDSRLLQTPHPLPSTHSKISFPGAIQVSFSSKADSVFPAPRSLRTEIRLHSSGFSGDRSRRGRGRGPWQ